MIDNCVSLLTGYAWDPSNICVRFHDQLYCCKGFCRRFKVLRQTINFALFYAYHLFIWYLAIGFKIYEHDFVLVMTLNWLYVKIILNMMCSKYKPDFKLVFLIEPGHHYQDSILKAFLVFSVIHRKQQGRKDVPPFTNSGITAFL